MKLETSSLHKAATYVLVMALGIALTLLWAAASVDAKNTERIKKLEADVRTESGKRLDQGENFEDQLAEARSERALELWTVQGKLDACLKDKK